MTSQQLGERQRRINVRFFQVRISFLPALLFSSTDKLKLMTLDIEILSNVVYLRIKPHLSDLSDRAHQSEFRL
jgi:hypothetical protein